MMLVGLSALIIITRELLMSTTLASLLAAALLPLAPLALRPADDSPKKEKEFAPLQGTWKLASMEIEGKEVDLLPAKPPRWVIRGNKVLYAGQELAVLTLDTSTTPHSIDLAFVSPKKVYEGVYEVGKDTLKVCVNRQTEGVKDRPLGFATKDKPDLRLLVFKREKDLKDPTEGLAGYAGVAIRADSDPKQLVIAQVLAGSPAKKAGLKRDDVLVAVGGQEATELRAVIRLVQLAKPRSELTFRVRRDGKEQDITVKVGVMPFYLLD
jgi:uncharacterized protein (TIGR03067 family)